MFCLNIVVVVVVVLSGGGGGHQSFLSIYQKTFEIRLQKMTVPLVKLLVSRFNQ